MTVKPKKCKRKNCDKSFIPYKTTDIYCSFNCAKIDGAIKPINKVSKKRNKINLEYEILKKDFFSLPENKFCKIKGTNCTSIADTIEHSAGRVGKNLTDVSKWIPACVNCNLELETNTELSRKHQFSRFHSGKKIVK